MARFSALSVLVALLVTRSSAASAQLLEIEYTPAARSQIAIWIEREDGTFVATIGLTESVARRGLGNRPGASQLNSSWHFPYGRREGVLPVWAHRRARAAGAGLFRRVIFQDRPSEGHAEGLSLHLSPDPYYCLSRLSSVYARDGLDALTCASQTEVRVDHGRYLTDLDRAAGYAEPIELRDEGGSLVAALRPLPEWSLYPPRRDLPPCPEGARCRDLSEDARGFAADALEVMPELDSITMATPSAEVPQRWLFTVPGRAPGAPAPGTWERGLYSVWLEINTEGDYNAFWNDRTLPTPSNPPPEDPEAIPPWDRTALTTGYAYRGQPSVVFQVRFELGEVADRGTAAEPVGMGSLHGWEEYGTEVMMPMDSTITDDPARHPGSGADRLRRTEQGWRLRVLASPPSRCANRVAPGDIRDLEVIPSEGYDGHRWAIVSFGVPSHQGALSRYDLRVSTAPITSIDDFLRAEHARSTDGESEARASVSGMEGERVEVEIGGLVAETEYWIAARAVDAELALQRGVYACEPRRQRGLGTTSHQQPRVAARSHVLEEDSRHVAGREHEAGDAGLLRALGHPVELRGALVLHHDEPAVLVHLADAPRPVAPAPGEHDRDGARAAVVGERAEERVDRERELVGPRPIAQEQPPIGDHHLLLGRDQINVIRLDPHPVLHQMDRDFGMASEELVHQGFEVRREMLDDDEGHPALPWHALEEPLERFQAACRCPDTHDVEGPLFRGSHVTHDHTTAAACVSRHRAGPIVWTKVGRKSACSYVWPVHREGQIAAIRRVTVTDCY